MTNTHRGLRVALAAVFVMIASAMVFVALKSSKSTSHISGENGSGSLVAEEHWVNIYQTDGFAMASTVSASGLTCQSAGYADPACRSGASKARASCVLFLQELTATGAPPRYVRGDLTLKVALRQAVTGFDVLIASIDQHYDSGVTDAIAKLRGVDLLLHQAYTEIPHDRVTGPLTI
jgi:hypothetical protein